MKNQTMIRVIKDKNNPYVMLNKIFLNDEKLSWKSKGILAYLLSLPDDWQIYSTEVVKHSKDGISSFTSGLKELMDNGYVSREQKRNERGHFIGYEYCVYEVSTESRKSENGKSNNGKSNTTNNNLTNNNKTNNEYIHLPSEDAFVSFYLKAFRRCLGKEHMRVKVADHYYILGILNELRSWDIDYKTWCEAVEEHFTNLPKSNNGNILAFLKASKRYFDVEI